MSPSNGGGGDSVAMGWLWRILPDLVYRPIEQAQAFVQRKATMVTTFEQML